MSQEEKISSWIGTLIEKEILISRGIKKGTEYLLNHELFSQAKLDLKPSLKTIEPYVLEKLILEYLRYNGKSKMKEIQTKLKEIPAKEIAKVVYQMSKNGVIEKEGSDKTKVYFVIQNKSKK